jgi:hypothetical protein
MKRNRVGSPHLLLSPDVSHSFHIFKIRILCPEHRPKRMGCVSIRLSAMGSFSSKESLGALSAIDVSNSTTFPCSIKATARKARLSSFCWTTLLNTS